VHFILAGFFPLISFDSSLELSFLGFGHNASLMLRQQLVRILIRAAALSVRVVVVIQNQKEFASRCDDLRICVLDSLPDRVHRLVIIPDVALVQLDHYVEGLASRFLIWVLQQGKDKVLQLFIDYVVFRVFVKLFQVCYYDAVEVLAE
jgi:hypothetical protein